MIKFTLSFFSVLFLVFASGCATVTPVKDASTTVYSVKSFKNYKINQKMKVVVGDPILAVQLYNYSERFSENVSVSGAEDVFLLGNTLSGAFVIKANEKHKILGEFVYNGENYILVGTKWASTKLAGAISGFYALVNKSTGKLNGKVAQNRGGGSITVVPHSYEFDASKILVRDSEMVIDTRLGKPYENYELLYAGVNATGINLTYREFSPDGLARAAFYQNLIYPADAKIINFKKYKIVVYAASSESIEFEVVEDGL
jgi:hypothetical protein